MAFHFIYYSNTLHCFARYFDSLPSLSRIVQIWIEVSPSTIGPPLVYEIRRCHIIWSKILTHWGRTTHICVSKLTIIGSDNGLSPGRRQAIIWINARILLIEPLGINFSEMLTQIDTFSLKKMHLKMSLGRRQPSCLGLNVLIKRSALSGLHLS